LKSVLKALALATVDALSSCLKGPPDGRRNTRSTEIGSPKPRAELEWDVPPEMQARACPACGTGRPQIRFVLLHSDHGVDYAFWRCLSCGSVWHEGSGAQYETTWPGSFSSVEIDQALKSGLDVAIQCEHDIEGILRDTFRLYRTVSQSGASSRCARRLRFLDTGCGIAYSVDFLNKTFACDAYGVEPAIEGFISSQVLGVRTFKSFDEAMTLGYKWDIIYLSQVIEHIPNPVAFLASIREALSNQNSLCELNTPNGLVLAPSLGESRLKDFLANGQHLCLFSPKGLFTVLERAGFRYTEVGFRSSDGTDLSALASSMRIEKPINPDEDFMPYYVEYLKSLADIDNWHFSLGGAYRLLRHYVHRGEWDNAQQWRERIGELIRREHNVHDSADIMLRATSSMEWRDKKYPLCLAGIEYFTGMIELNRFANPVAALHRFERSREILRRMAEIKLLPHEQRQYFWESIYHSALSKSRSGEAFSELLALITKPLQEDVVIFGYPFVELLQRASQLAASVTT